MDSCNNMIQSNILHASEQDEPVQVVLARSNDIAQSLPPLQPHPVNISRISVIGHWYTNTSTASTSCDEIICNAYSDAKAIFCTELTQDECKRIWVEEHVSMSNVTKALNHSKLKYDSKPASKARKWLGILSGRVTHYSTVLDVLVQQYPEYVSLAWGAMKFLFIAVNNHEEKTKQLAKAFSRIAEILPRTDLALILYPTDLMRDAVAHLYARILKFIVQAIKWYKQNKFVHTFGAIAKPWALSFKDNVDDIAAQSRYIDELSSTASKAELRDTHLDIIHTRAEIRDARIEIRGLTDLFNTRTNVLVQNVLVQNALVQNALADEVRRNQMLPDIPSGREMLSSTELSHLLSLDAFEKLPSPKMALCYCTSLLQRNKNRAHIPSSQIALLQQWACTSKSSLLLLDGSFRNLSKGVLVDLLNLLDMSGKALIWALRFPDYWDAKLSSSSILCMLLKQALQLNPSSLSHPTTSLTHTQLSSASTDRDWFQLLNQALIGIPRIFIAIDADLLSVATDNSVYRATRWLENVLGSINTTSLKVFIAANAVDEDYMSRNWEPETWVKVFGRTDNNRRGNRGRNVLRPNRHKSSSLRADWLPE